MDRMIWPPRCASSGKKSRFLGLGPPRRAPGGNKSRFLGLWLKWFASGGKKYIWFLSVCASGGKKSMFDSFGSFFRVLNHRFPTFYYFFLWKHIFLRMLQLLLYKNVCFQWHSKYLAVFLEKRETFGAKPDFGRTSFSGSTAVSGCGQVPWYISWEHCSAHGGANSPHPTGGSLPGWFQDGLWQFTVCSWPNHDVAISVFFPK